MGKIAAEMDQWTGEQEQARALRAEARLSKKEGAAAAGVADEETTTE